MPFRKVSEVIGLLLPTHLSHMMIYNHFEKVAEALDEQDRLRAKNLFEDGVIEHPGTKVCKRLFISQPKLTWKGLMLYSNRLKQTLAKAKPNE